MILNPYCTCCFQIMLSYKHNYMVALPVVTHTVAAAAAAAAAAVAAAAAAAAAAAIQTSVLCRSAECI